MTGETIRLRRGEPGDAARLAQFGAGAFETAFGADNTAEDMASYLEEAFSQATFAAQLGDPQSTFLLLEDGDRIVGYSMLRSGEPPAAVDGPGPMELVRIYADPLALGTGLGAKLMSASLEAAASAGHQTIWLGVWERNQGAIAFYQRWGFTKVGEKTFMLGSDPQTDHLMARRI